MTHLYNRCISMCVITLIGLLSLHNSSAQWTNLNANLPGNIAIYQSQQVALNGKLYMFGGRVGNSYLANAWVLDLTTSGAQWTQIEPMPSVRAGGYAAAVNGKIYIMAGLTVSGSAAVEQSSVLEFNPENGEYTEKAEIINTVAQVAGAVIGKKIFLFNGLSGTSSLKQIQVYDVEKDAWDEIVEGTKYVAAYATATAISDTVYLMGGFTGSALTNTAYRGVVAADNSIAWTKIANLPVANAAGASGNDGKNVFFFGGQTNSGSVNTCYKYNVKTNRWSSTFMLPSTADMNLVAPNINEKVYIISGQGNPSTFEFVDGPPTPIFNLSRNKLFYFMKTGNEKTMSAVIFNSGNEPLKGDIIVPSDKKWLSVVSTSYEVAPGATEIIEVTANSTGMSQGDYEGVVTITSNDAKVASTAINVTMKLVDNPYKRVPVIEVFTSSTCPPCKPGNEVIHSVLEDFTPDQYTMIKYQEYFPGTGDPYTTFETIERGALYQINNGIPFVAVDNKWVGNPNTTFNSDVITSASEEGAVAQLVSSYSITDNKVNVNVDIESLVNYQSENLRLHVAIAEKETTKNRKNNGETEFYHVVKKMLPDAKGTTITGLNKNEKMTKSFEFEFPGNYRLPSNGQTANLIKLDSEHSVEEFSDLEVIVWMEDLNNELSFNSSAATSVSSVEELPDNSGLSFVEVYPNPTAGMTTFRFKAEKSMNVTLELFDLAGNKVASLFNAAVAPGEYPVMFDMATLPTGQYNMWLKTNDKFIGRTITVTK
ncbi:MAG: kelch repeat-containing protein [Candidatus Kapaibacterium sp.]